MNITAVKIGEARMIQSPPKPRACLTLIPEFRVYTTHIPNGWWRFWQWLLLGWHWRRL
jgi:hypothetical protein